MAKMTFRGEPYVVDIVLRPLLSAVRWAVGVGLGALFWWLELIWWVPVPVVVATVVLEGWLLLRSDRPIRITMDGDKLVIDDRFAATLTVFRDRVRAVTVLHQPRSDAGRPGHELVIVVLGERRVLAAVAVQTVELPALPPGAVDVARMDGWLGAGAGILRAVAPLPRICRQRVFDRSLVAAVAEWAGSEALDHRGLRLWSGASPDLSPFGFHTDEATGILRLGAERWTFQDLDGRERTGGRQCAGWQLAEREAVLLGLAGTDEPVPGVLPLLVLTLPADDGSTLRVAVPAPAHGGEERTPVDDDVFHTHAPEGAVLLAWLDEVGALPADLPVPPDLESEPRPDEGDTPKAAPGDPRR